MWGLRAIKSYCESSSCNRSQFVAECALPFLYAQKGFYLQNSYKSKICRNYFEWKASFHKRKREFFNELLHYFVTFIVNTLLFNDYESIFTFSLASRKAFVINFIHPSTISSSCVDVIPSRLIFIGSTFIFTLSSSSIICSWLEALNSVGKLNVHIAWSIVL